MAAVTANPGDVYGSWTILADCNYEQKYKCQCVCGNTANVRIHDLRSKKSSRCKACASTSKSTQPTISDRPEYKIWTHILQRTRNPKCKDYPNYGGRGIDICDMWADSFEAFYLCVGPRPSEYHSIERLDVNRGYEVGNVVWETSAAQSLNKRSTVRVTIDGETKAVSEWAKDPRCVVPLKTVYKRIARGWTGEDAVLTPTKTKDNTHV